MINRRHLIKVLAASPLFALSSKITQASNLIQTPNMTLAASEIQKISKLPKILKTIPKSGEKLASIGMGSSRTFNVSGISTEFVNLTEVLSTFFETGGQLIDSSPMYGLSEKAIGNILSKLDNKQNLFAASKVWTYGKQAGMEAILESQRRMQVNKMDLMQVHNLRDWEIHIATLNEFKQAKKLRYTGITTSSLGQYEDFERVINKTSLDFIQLNYNISVREAEKRLLPLAKDKGIAVIVNMPFEKGRLFNRTKGKQLPEWTKEFDCKSWGQFFLKFIISHPQVTCAIPATSKVHHMLDNMSSMRGTLPDKKMRNKMVKYFDSL